MSSDLEEKMQKARKDRIVDLENSAKSHHKDWSVYTQVPYDLREPQIGDTSSADGEIHLLLENEEEIHAIFVRLGRREDSVCDKVEETKENMKEAYYVLNKLEDSDINVSGIVYTDPSGNNYETIKQDQILDEVRYIP